MFISKPSNPSATVSVDENVSATADANESNKSSMTDTDNNAESNDDSRTTATTTKETLSESDSSNSSSDNNNSNPQPQPRRQKKAMPPSRYVTESQKRSVQFPWKLHEMLDDVEECGHTDIVHWLPTGDAFYVRDCERFVAEIMPLYFSQKFYKSFQRQLNMWGFSKVRHGPNKGAIGNEFFQRNQPDLCCSMKRIKIKGCGKFRKQPRSSPTTENTVYSNSAPTSSNAAANRRPAVDIAVCPDAFNNNSVDQQPTTNSIAMALLDVLQQASAIQRTLPTDSMTNDQSMTAALALLVQQQQQEIEARQLLARQQQQAKEDEAKRSVLLASLMLGSASPSIPVIQASPNNAALMALLRLTQNHAPTM